MMKFYQWTRKLTNRGIMTFGIIMTAISIRFSMILYTSEYARRLSINHSYSGEVGGEGIIPFAVFGLFVIICCARSEFHD